MIMEKLSGRYEFKYLLTRRQAELIERYFNQIGLQKDSSQGGEYFVTSLYFETPTLSDYYDKSGGYLQRQKLRARVYEECLEDAQGPVRLEVKMKNDMRSYKTRPLLSKEKWSDFLKSGPVSFYSQNKDEEAGDSKGLKHFLDLFIKKCYKPHIVVRYKRKAFVGQFLSDMRLTLDSNIEAAKWRGGRGFPLIMAPVYKGKVVLEVKFGRGGVPWWFKNLLRKFNLSRQSFSKYNHSVEAINKLNPLPR